MTSIATYRALTGHCAPHRASGGGQEGPGEAAWNPGRIWAEVTAWGKCSQRGRGGSGAACRASPTREGQAEPEEGARQENGRTAKPLGVGGASGRQQRARVGRQAPGSWGGAGRWGGPREGDQGGGTQSSARRMSAAQRAAAHFCAAAQRTPSKACAAGPRLRLPAGTRWAGEGGYTHVGLALWFS